MFIDKFNFEGLMQFIEEKVNKTTASPEYRELIKKLVEYGTANRRTTKDGLCHFLCDTIPGLSFEEVVVFENDEHLTVGAIQEKQRKTLALEISFEQVKYMASEQLVAMGFRDNDENIFKVLSRVDPNAVMGDFKNLIMSALAHAIRAADQGEDSTGGYLLRCD